MHQVPAGTATLLFADLEGSTRLLQQVGEESYKQILADYRQLLRTACAAFDGHEVDTQGDAFFLIFARATAAVSAAVAMQRSIAQHGWPEGRTIRVRIGLHTGEPQQSALGYIGVDVHQAARIMSAGHGGQVLLSQTVAALVEPHLPAGVRLQDLGIHRLKDLAHPVHLFQLLIDGLPTDFPALKTLEHHPNNLPLQPTAFIGREQEIARLRDLLLREEVRLLTLTGPPGVGKTRLGLRVGAELSEQFPDGVFFVPLAPVTQPQQVIPAILHTLSIREPEPTPLSPLASLAEALQEKRLLLLLDDFEQVVEAGSDVAALLSACPGIKVLVTSRVVLHLQAEWEVVVSPLSVPRSPHSLDPAHLAQYEAVALFVARAQAVRTDFQLTAANAAAVMATCARLDGLPLAIELAAARTRYFSPSQLVTQLDSALALLSQGARDLPARQQTLRGAMAWSYQLLSQPEQQLFQRLAVFVGSCDLQAASRVCTAASPLPFSLLEGLLALVDKSLLWPLEDEQDSPRFRMLQLLREFGLECLEQAGETEATREAHAAYYLWLAEQSLPVRDPVKQKHWHARLEQERDNLRAALSSLLEGAQREGQLAGEQALRLCLALTPFWLRRGYFREAHTFFELALENRASGGAALRAEAFAQLANLEMLQDDYAEAQAHLTEGLALSESLEDIRGKAHCLVGFARLALIRCEWEMVRTRVAEVIMLCQEVGEYSWRAYALILSARVSMLQGEYRQGQALLEESLRCYQAAEDADALWSLTWLARLLWLSNQDLARATALAEQCLEGWREIEGQKRSAYALNILGHLHLKRGEAEEARARFEQGLSIVQETGDRAMTAEILLGLANVSLHQEDPLNASRLCQQSIALLRAIDSRQILPRALEGWGIVLLRMGEPARAVHLWGAALARRETLGIPRPPIEQEAYEPAVREGHAQLGEKAFTEAMARGRDMTLEEILAMGSKAASEALFPQGVSSAPASAASSRSPAGLTAREEEVLRLVAQGLTNAQMAKRLVISPRTVNTHLTSIYSKIGVTSRAAATRYAIEHHLV
jgi:predicted ATPase/class 3 adenylate cyclase/DNA-binding CsgD family transcriptional regulator/tetratricopeptide (TPR) repeat protein